MEAAILLLGLLGFVLLFFLVASIKVVQQFEQGIVFRFGQVQLTAVRGPGLTAIVPIVDRMQKVNMQTVAMGVPAQDGITQDNVSVRVDAVVYFRIIDPVKAIVNIQNYGWAISQVAQTSLRSVIGKADMQQLLSERETINRELAGIIDEMTENPWGIRIERVEIKDVSLPEGMKRSMARQAEAERERRARIITADGEYQASKRLAAAAHELSKDPASLQLRLLQTVTEVAAEKNSTLVMPLPVEMLRFFDKMAGGPGSVPAEEQPIEEPPPLESADDVPPVASNDEIAAVEAAQDAPIAAPARGEPEGLRKAPPQPGIQPPQPPR
ncbi:SPFH domain-containing protein [Actinomadura sp. HBU206391]|uniref:SPFH domain-containing protein n=1 Tax=Actinomadura sp. HBU206391 TaxID=2731692 RepID=UPI001C9BC42C|nr:SPFH domain-containing protein [Actinomadura sp. HBU206391]